jgi:NAD(P)-dependent dehydrogenase (short-subunit alcohol dehydrogenase family)
VTAQQVYDETAATTDLRRLPEPDEVANAVVFLASPMASAITGQCLDVNSGEYHH